MQLVRGYHEQAKDTLGEKFWSVSEKIANHYSQCSLTQATDTSNIRLVFAAVKDTILHNALADSGIL